MKQRKRYALVGASGRGLGMYAYPLKEEYADVAEVVGIFDPNPVRSAYVKEFCRLDCRTYTDYDRMIRETRPETVIVTTVDRYHHEYIIRALEAGLDAITEKPMTVDLEKCRQILETEARTGRKVIVTFNYRFTPYITRIRELLRDGLVGTILNVDFEWLLDTRHGADYFRRWHRRKENSGGLLVHKATHHFDAINWWVGEEPEVVNAFGSLRFYGPNRKKRGQRCLTCRHRSSCEFYFDLTANERMVKMYLEAEKHDGYHRDGCVFSEEIDIEDSMSVNVRYSGGALLTYSLVAHSPYEGFRASVSGTDGRIEVAEYQSGDSTGGTHQTVTFFNRRNERITYQVPKATGGHGGGDTRLRRMLFRGDLPDPLNHMAGSYEGAISMLIGAAANRSIARGRAIRIQDHVPLADYRKR
ncbi:MAG TPA: Gfo/Idh/MocA family oxidoreductase [bacterium]|uniref:Putative oxidoreductase YteT n=1 Tax=candidate division TA06 bacterium ADurb.Bin417 TaxID=1852828 RepID=A0A1V5MGF6_UNCT6|nr:MAG: putative oxidoreductase YteT precursor [candidate division TA06 bacterium ADurb.Bin417]HNQ34952.1 Gfo/Idh/MocA family oxidoreductase [bacterium]HNS48116.1 Gfo/Idh/MocA family oxidoreductase [bacterium]